MTYNVGSMSIWNSVWRDFGTKEITSHVPEQMALMSKGEDCTGAFGERYSV